MAQAPAPRPALATHGDSPGAPMVVLVIAALVILAVMVLNLPPQAPLALFAAVVGSLFFFSRPALAIIVFFAIRTILDLLWWVPGSFLSLNLMEIFTGGVSGLVAVLFVLSFRRMDRHPCTPAFLTYMAVLAIGGLRNLEIRSAAEILARYTSPLLMMLVVTAFFETRKKRRQFLVVLTLVTTIPVLVSLYHLASGQMNTYVLAGYQRLQGSYKNLHTHALTMMYIATLAVFWFHTLRRSNRRYWAVAYGLGAIVCLYFTYVRTALLGLGAFLLVFLVLTRQRRILGAGLAVGVLFVLLSPTMQDRFKDLALIFLPDQAVMDRAKLGSGRWGLWTASFKEYLSYPAGDIILGLGLGKHWILTREYFNPFDMAQGGYVDPHNDYLTMTYQVGPIATGSYLLMQLQTVRYGLRLHAMRFDAWSANLGAYGASITVMALVANMVSNSFINRTTLAWLMWGVAGIMFREYIEVTRRVNPYQAPRLPATMGEPARPPPAPAPTG